MSTAREYSNYKCGQHFQKVCVDTHPDYSLKYQIVENGTECYGQKAECEVAENAAENRLADNNGSKSDYDRTTSHVYVCEALVLSQKSTG